MYEKEVKRKDGSMVRVVAQSQEELDEALKAYEVKPDKKLPKRDAKGRFVKK